LEWGEGKDPEVEVKGNDLLALLAWLRGEALVRLHVGHIHVIALGVLHGPQHLQ
jgi:hypothetical protein